MDISPSSFPLQRLVRKLPRFLRRIKVTQALAAMTGSSYQLIEFQQGQLVGNIRDRGIANYLISGSFPDSGYFRLARNLLSNDDTHVDIGANYGFHTFGILDHSLKANRRHVLIDANPDCADCLRASAKLHPGFNFEIFHIAAAMDHGVSKFTFEPHSTGTGHIGNASSSGEVEIQVPTAPLDDLFEDNNIGQVGLMKIDIEGSEPRAFQSLERALSNHRIRSIYFEVNPFHLQLQNSSPAALFRTLTRHGYRLYWPHDDATWISKCYGRPQIDSSELKTRVISGTHPHAVVEFDEDRYAVGGGVQCDLLALPPEQKFIS